MALIKARSRGINLADNFAFTGTITGAGGGKVLQVVTVNKTGNSQNTTSSSYADVTNLTANITPSATSSYLLVNVQVSTQNFGNNSTTAPHGRVSLTDGSTNFVECSVYHYTGSNNHYHLGTQFMQHYYNPNTTSQVSLKLQLLADSGRFGVFGEDDQQTIKPTTITVMEISA
jgi:hypothetical protein